MINLKEETLEMMDLFDKTVDDIAWIGGYTFSIPVDLFFELADVEYDDDYGSQKVAKDLKIVFKDNTAMYRREYDGKEWWQFINLNQPQIERTDVYRLVSADWSSGYEALCSLNQ